VVEQGANCGPFSAVLLVTPYRDVGLFEDFGGPVGTPVVDDHHVVGVPLDAENGATDAVLLVVGGDADHDVGVAEGFVDGRGRPLALRDL
jgi:hypothetical protein